jgi:hypothetical protein
VGKWDLYHNTKVLKFLSRHLGSDMALPFCIFMTAIFALDFALPFSPLMVLRLFGVNKRATLGRISSYFR